MSGSMRAEYRLDLLDGLSRPAEAMERAVERLTAAINGIGRSDPFTEFADPIPRATRSVDELHTRMTELMDGIRQTSEAAIGMTSSLEATGEAAAETGTALDAMGTEAAEGAERATGALDRMRRAMEAVRAVRDVHVRFGDEDGGGGSGGSGGGGFGGRVGGVVQGARHFHESVERSVGQAFGALAAGFGLVEPVHAAAEYDNTLTHIGIGLGLSGDANRQFVGAYGTQIDALARATDTRGADLAEAAGFFSREGYRQARLDAVLPQVAQIATAYNAAPDAVAKSTFALQENLGIGDGGVSQALATLALVGKQADLPFEQLAPLFPELAAMGGAVGIQGQSGVADLAAALGVTRKQTGTSGEAVTDVRAFLQTIGSSHTAHRFAGYGVDLFGVEENARRQGLDPMLAVLQQVNRITRGGQDQKALGTLFNNQEDRLFVQAMLRHIDQFFDIRNKISGATPQTITTDFHTGQQSTLTQLTAFEEALAQLNRRIGTGFVPVLRVATEGIDHLIDGIDQLNKAAPGALPVILATVGGVLALAAVIGVLGAVTGPLTAGFGVLRAGAALVLPAFEAVSAAGVAVAGAWALAAVGLGVVAYEVYEHWSAIRHGFSALLTWIGSWAASIVQAIEAPFAAVAHRLERVIGLDAGQSVQEVKPVGRTLTPAEAIARDRAAHPDLYRAQIHVTHDPGLTVTPTSTPRLQITTQPGLGRMVNRP